MLLGIGYAAGVVPVRLLAPYILRVSRVIKQDVLVNVDSHLIQRYCLDFSDGR